MGNKGFQGEARVPAESSIVQERNKAATSYLHVTTSYLHATTQASE